MRLILALPLVLIHIGCSRPMGDVEGRVLANGTPLEFVAITFAPDPHCQNDGPAVFTFTDTSGAYQARSVTGVHRVMLRDVLKWQSPTKESRIPRQYESARTPLSLEIQQGTQALDIDIPVNHTR